MISIVLAFSACLVDNPAKCKDVELVYSAEEVTQMQCLMTAPVQLAKWNESHPRWRTQRWTCRQGGTLARI
jgi:hypothetical protein